MTKILLIDDSEDIGALVGNGLSPHLIVQALSLAEADAALKQPEDFSLILIDICLPDGSGMDLCLRLQQDARFKNIPKIILTAMDRVSEKVYAFNCGADDYLTKPFHPIELRARVERYLRKSQASEPAVVTYSSFTFNLEFQRCTLLDGANKIDFGLTPTEFRIFLTLAKSEGRVITRRMLEQATWEANGTAIQIRGIDTHVAHLRKKLGVWKDAIVSVYGQGYSFQGAEKKSEAA
jgi:DNA-binding response OmpR family regulator